MRFNISEFALPKRSNACRADEIATSNSSNERNSLSITIFCTVSPFGKDPFSRTFFYGTLEKSSASRAELKTARVLSCFSLQLGQKQGIPPENPHSPRNQVGFVNAKSLPKI